MSKKSLSDLVREEVGREAVRETSESRLEKTVQKTQSEQSAKPSARSRVTKVQLEAKVSELMASLAAIEANEFSLTEEIKSLKSQLQAEKKKVKTIQQQAQKNEQLEADLLAQKELINKLYSEIKKGNDTTEELEKQKKINQELESKLAESRKITVPSQPKPKSNKLMVRKPRPLAMPPNRPIGRLVKSNQSSSRLSNDDIGWFD